MAAQPRNYIRGLLSNQIEFDPGRPRNTSGGNGDIFHGKLHRERQSDDSPFQYSDVALKRMRCGTADEDNRFRDILKEACVWMDLCHPNLLRFMGILFDGQDLYLVSPFASNGSVLQFIRAHPDQGRPKILWQIAAGICYLHSQNIVHGDVKGANVLIFGGPVAKICDFGLSKHLDGRQTTNPQYSLAWTSPERWNGEPRSYASDIYAFGMTIYEILSGKAPFTTLSRDDFNQRVCINGERPPMDPDSSPGGIPYALLWEIARRCWQTNPSWRPTTEQARDFIVRMEVVEGEFAASNSDVLLMHSLPMPPVSSDTATFRRKRSDNTGSSPTDRPKKRLMFDHRDEADADIAMADPPIGLSQENLHRVNTLPRARTASHHAAKGAQSLCLAGTRTAVLQKIYDWVEDTDPMTPRVFWLNGMAGTGKSTIAKTLAERAEKEGVLGASFFFDRHGQPEVRNGELFVPTIAFQLAQAIPSFQNSLAAALAKDLDVLSFTRQSQLQKLITEPLQVMTLSKPLLIVIDALDECETNQSNELLQLLLAMMSNPRTHSNSPILRLFIACRPIRNLDIAFRTAQEHDKLILHDVERDIVQADIELYLRDGLTNPPPHPSLPSNWISMADLKRLSQKSGVLFIYATTILKYIRDNEFDSSRDRLKSLLHSGQGTITTREHALADLDDLYLQVLRAAITFRNTRNSEVISKHAAERIRAVLGAMVVLRSPLPIGALINLLGISPDQMQTTMEHLQSVVVTPKSTQDPPQFLHQSFPDFIVDSGRCPDHRFVVHTACHERRLAAYCLTVMIALLKRNISEGFPKGDGSSVDAIHHVEFPREHEEGGMMIEEMKYNATGLELIYACRNWASHLGKSPNGEPELLELLGHFTSRFLLWWLEVLSRTGYAAEAVRAADEARKWARLSGASEETISLLHDTHRFVLAHLPSLREDARHVYDSALPFTPRGTRLWKRYQHEASLSVHVRSGVEDEWSPCLSVLVTPREDMETVEFSIDGTRIVSQSFGTMYIWDAVSGALITGLGENNRSAKLSPDGGRVATGSNDGIVRMWDTGSAQCIATMEGHSRKVYSVAFSPDGSRLASGSEDGTTRLWDTASAQHIATMEDQPRCVYTVAFSPDGTRILSDYLCGTVCIWKAISGEFITRLKDVPREASTMKFAPDGSRLASSSEGGTINIWDAISGQQTLTLNAHSEQVWTVVFCPDGTQLVSGSEEGTICIWSAITGQLVRTLVGHFDSVMTIAFSPDGSKILSGSYDRTALVWDADSGQITATLKGHSEAVVDVVFSPDGSRLASGSNDGTIRIWDAVSNQHTETETEEGHWSSVKSIEFSPDGTRVVSTSNGAACVWDAISGKFIGSLGKYNCAVVFSPDGSLLASRAWGGKVCIWDAAFCERIGGLKGHSSSVETLTFSPDGARIATGSWDHTVCIWDTVSRKYIDSLKGHSHCVVIITFSTDGCQIASGDSDGTVCIWNAITRQHIANLKGHSLPTEIAFSPDSSRIGIKSYGRAVGIWDAFSDGFVAVLGPLDRSEYVDTFAFRPICMAS